MNASKFEQRGFIFTQKYYQTKAKLRKFKSLNYHVISIWEHTFNKFLKSNKHLNEEISNHSFMKYSKLNARSAVYGGRNEAGKLFYKVKEGEKMKFYDYCSLYSYSMLTRKYFIREPYEILMHKQCKNITSDHIKKMDGLVLCKVLTNPKLVYPVLPYRCVNKLMFPSCRTCTEKLSINPCTLSIEQRAIVGTWSTCELKPME